jgi:hypothetical protein
VSRIFRTFDQATAPVWAEYRNSGVMTFIVSYDGKVFQKDLGPNTATLAQLMAAFNPDKSWQKVSDITPVR